MKQTTEIEPQMTFLLKFTEKEYEYYVEEIRPKVQNFLTKLNSL